MSIEARILGRRKAGALIGPNAVLQAVAVMEERLGHAETAAILADAQITRLPSGDNMIPELDAIRLHRWMSLHDPMGAMIIAEEAGARTADYIIANRIPPAAVWLLRHLPSSFAAIFLMSAIRKHAWTFVGAGKFNPIGAWKFEIDRSVANDPVLPPDSLLVWYAKVFEQLYRRLVSPACSCELDEVPRAVPNHHQYRIVRS